MTFSGHDPVSLVQGWSYALTKDAKQPEAAATFIKFMLTKEMQVINASIGGEMPSRVSSFDDPWFTSTEKGREMLQWKDWLVQYGRLGAYHPEFWKWSEALMNSFHELLLEHAESEVVLSKWANWYNEEVGL
jgi:ABC-type glycerol-3-phosphate transport system substrate-binding protein